MKVALITLGCPKNLVDAEVMLGLLDRAGHSLVGDPAGADVVIVNTCAFIASAVSEARETVGRCLDLKRRGLVHRVVVAGCLPQRYGARTAELLDGVDGVVGCSCFLEIADVIAEAAAGRAPVRVSEHRALYDHESPRVLGTPRHLAYVKIAEGCDNRCAYCTVPSLRGPLRSRRPDSIVAETEALLELGVSEVNLIAQDTTAYGTDLASRVRLPELLERLSRTGAPWIRVLYAHPAHVTDELLGAMGGLRGVVPYLDLPIQHVSDRILGSMGRGTDGESVRSVIERLRRAVPGVTVRSSVMVGYPGETEEEFRELLSFVAEGSVDALGVFEFSPEPGTRAAALGPRVGRRRTAERARAIMEAMAGAAAARGAAAVGRVETVLVDEDGPSAVGRTAGQAWEIDGRFLLEGGAGAAGPGSFLRARVTAASGYDLVGVALAPAAGAAGGRASGRRRARPPGGESA
jgi:ribosomal protein S12 methylthiotransferase